MPSDRRPVTIKLRSSVAITDFLDRFRMEKAAEEEASSSSAASPAPGLVKQRISEMASKFGETTATNAASGGGNNNNNNSSRFFAPRPYAGGGTSRSKTTSVVFDKKAASAASHSPKSRVSSSKSFGGVDRLEKPVAPAVVSGASSVKSLTGKFEENAFSSAKSAEVNKGADACLAVARLVNVTSSGFFRESNGDGHPSLGSQASSPTSSSSELPSYENLPSTRSPDGGDRTPDIPPR